MLGNSLMFCFRQPATRRKPFRTIYRILTLQIRLRTARTFIKTMWLDRIYIELKRKDYALTANLYYGLAEYEDMAFAYHLLRPNDYFFDVGANLGSYTLLLAKLKAVRCIAFEPVRSTFKHFQRNIEANRLNALVEAFNFAVGANPLADNRYVSITNDNSCTNCVVSDDTLDRNTETIIVCALDDFVGNAPVLLKIDVEGYELEVLRGSSTILSSPELHCIIIENQSDGVNKTLLDFDFLPYIYEPKGRTLTNSYSKSRNQIWIRRTRLDDVAMRVVNSPHLDLDLLGI
jgi:FkbM family methyltransferase